MPSRSGLIRYLGLFGGHVFKVTVVFRLCLRGQNFLEVISSRPGLIIGHVLKVKQDHVFKVRVFQKSCLQGQGCLEVMSSRLGLFRGYVFKVRIA